jgi:prepilin-type processing-associated H-X9-DG protein
MSNSTQTPQTLNYAAPSLAEPTRKWGVIAGAVGVAAVALFIVSRYWLEAYHPVPNWIALAVGISAVMIGFLGVARSPAKASRGGVLLSFVGLALGTAAAAGTVLLPPPFICSYRRSPVLDCGTNLRQIGQAMVLYAMDNAGKYPTSIADLLTQDITSAIFVCPSTNDTIAATAATTEATAANVTAGGHLSYAITCAGFTAPPPVDAILAYEPLANHGNSGMNVLFGDGRVEWLWTTEARKLLAELKAGHNPPRPEAIK